MILSSCSRATGSFKTRPTPPRDGPRFRFARELGFETVNVVRRAELIEELRAEGGDVVLLDNDDLREAVGRGDRRRADPARAECGRRRERAAPGQDRRAGSHDRDLRRDESAAADFPNGLLIFKNLHFTGFWVNKWYEQATAAQRAETFARIFELAQRGLLQTKVERAYSLGEFAEAVARASEGKRDGKIVFRM